MFSYLQGWVLLALQILVLVLCVVAVVDAGRRPPGAFTAAGKMTKNAWVVILVVATLLAFLGINGWLMFAIIAAVASIVYLVDVKPAVTPYSGRGGRGSSGPAGW